MGKNEKIIARANQLYNEGKFAEALELFEKSVVLYGTNSVELNIKKCKAKLNTDEGKHEVDLVTKLLLLNMDPGAKAENKASILREIRKKTSVKSENLVTKEVNPIPADWPKDLVLAPLPESTNDFAWMIKNRSKKKNKFNDAGLSVVIPTYNRSNILSITLACLSHQDTNFKFEVIVADDGSAEDISSVVRRFENLLDIKHVRHKDDGYRLCSIRNFGIRSAQYDWVAILDCDMAPHPKWVQSYCELLLQSEDWALIGPRKYVDTNGIPYKDFLKNKNKILELPEVRTNNAVAGREAGDISVDWRLKVFKETEDLRLCDEPFRYFSGGNVAFSKKWIQKAGWFDEDFAAWGGEDNEFAYRLYRAGCFFRHLPGALAYHQEPPGLENETDRESGHKITREMVVDRVPYFYRKIEKIDNAVIKKVPLVSIYIPAYNCERFIERCVNSALNQTIADLEVCICDDGSTDRTYEILTQNYGNNPRVRFLKQDNGGIGKASNTAVKMCRGFYIGQLDSDDFLNPDAVEICLKEFLSDRKLACVYTANCNIDLLANTKKTGYNWPVFSREKLTTSMIAHHFRMFTARAWNLTEGFSETMTNAIDYDMYLKLSEVGPFKHVNTVCYNRVLHGENTSIKKLRAQKNNHFISINKSLERQNILSINVNSIDSSSDSCRKHKFVIAK